MTPEARASFHENLEGLEHETLATAGLAATALNQAIESVVQQDYELAVMVINNDDRIDGRYLDVHQGVLSLLARQSPVASDLRLVAAILHAIMHIERIGDLCVNIAKLVPLMGQTPDGGREILERIERAGVHAQDQIKQAELAFSERRLDLAEDLVRQDDAIDHLNREIFYAATEIVGDTGAREWAAHATLIARYIERIGDHTVDIGEQIAFVISGEFREFTDASRPSAYTPEVSG
jgi:phosphate transport system protein